MLKNLTRFMVLMLMLAALAGCSADSVEKETETETEPETSETDDIYAAIESDQELIDQAVPSMPDTIGEVKSLNYKLLSFETPDLEEVSDDTVRKYLEDNILIYLTTELTEGSVEEGDTADIDYVGTLDGVAFDGGSAEGYDLTIGSGTFIEGFEEGLIGARIGETRVLTLTFPDNYSNTELAGKETEFTVTVNYIMRPMSFDEFDDETADELSGGEYPTRQEYLGELKEYLTESARASYYNSMYNNAIEAALKESDVTVTDEAIEWQLDVTTSNYELAVEQWGLTLAYYLYYMGTDYESFREMMRDSAEEGAKEVLIVLAICDEEGLTVDDEAKAAYCELNGYAPDELDEYLDGENQEIAIKWYLAGRTIIDSANVTFTQSEE